MAQAVGGDGTLDPASRCCGRSRRSSCRRCLVRAFFTLSPWEDAPRDGPRDRPGLARGLDDSALPVAAREGNVGLVVELFGFLTPPPWPWPAPAPPSLSAFFPVGFLPRGRRLRPPSAAASSSSSSSRPTACAEMATPLLLAPSSRLSPSPTSRCCPFPSSMSPSGTRGGNACRSSSFPRLEGPTPRPRPPRLTPVSGPFPLPPLLALPSENADAVPLGCNLASRDERRRGDGRPGKAYKSSNICCNSRSSS